MQHAKRADNNNQEIHSAMDMEMLDLQCMLSCLPEHELKFHPFTGAPIEDDVPQERAVCSASLTVLFDGAGHIMNKDFWQHQNIQTTLTTLKELNPQEDAIWLDFIPPFPGSLRLIDVHALDDIEPIIRSCRETLYSIRHDEYQSPLPLLSFLQVCSFRLLKNGSMTVR